MWKPVHYAFDTDIPATDEEMRYFIYYPPTKAIRLIDVCQSVTVDDVLELVKKEFNLNFQDSGPSETSIVLSYNGSDLKPKWPLADLSIPSGSIIRCLYREQKAADLYIHCGFNKQILKIFDESITMETTIATIRKIISEKLGLPLSTFCLETFPGKQRLYDQMKLMEYDLKIHDHVYLKVWRGYEKFINSCIRGFTEPYSHDDLIRHYQTQVALYIAAYYGHMELATSVMQLGARSDRPVVEHPSRQWSSETALEIFPEMLKCPIHIAVERGHVKIVDLFVRQSILCTQIRNPITGLLPYRCALDCAFTAKSKEEKQRYRVIYFYLHDKQYNLKIPLNSTGDYVSNLLTSTVSAGAVHRSSANLVFVSLPFYCRIIRWYERARERAWKKHGGRFHNLSQLKRVYPKKGLLGYKVLIDGYNNTFEVPPEQLRSIKSGGTLKSNDSDRYIGYTDEEREKIIKTKNYVKDFALDERKRAKQIAAANLQQSRRRPMFPNQLSVEHRKQSTQNSDHIFSSSEGSLTSKRLTAFAPDIKTYQSILEIDDIPIANHSLLSAPSAGKRAIVSNDLPTIRLSKTALNDKHPLPAIQSPSSEDSTSTNQLEALMSSVDAYTFLSTRKNLQTEQEKTIKRQNRLAEIKQSVEEQFQDQSIKPVPMSIPSERKSIDVENYIPLPDRPTVQRSSPIKSRIDAEVRRTTVKPYERYASATTRSTAVHCLQEAGYFKGKSWLKQVEISKEMVKNHVKRRIRRADQETNQKPVLLPLRTNIVQT